MIGYLLKKIFGSRNDRLIKQYRQRVQIINQLESKISQLSDEELQAKTQEFRDRLANKQTLDQILPEAFAVVREASRRVMGMRHYDVQLIGGMVLHEGKIGEMRTGEGKTLVGTLPAYLNALSGNGVHIITVNDYLASRDAKIMAKLHNFLGLTVGCIVADMSQHERRAAYACDITYGTNNEFGFDYLRDNMVYSIDDRVQRMLNYAIIDEVDSILIDEARTPLIISGQAEDNTEIYIRMNQLVPHLKRQEREFKEGEQPEEDQLGDFIVDEKNHQALLTEQGHIRAEELLTQAGLLREGSSLYDPMNINLMHHLYAALKAQHLYLLDQHYVIQDGEIVIVDEFTGRLMAGRRWSDGLHQAVEAKEGVEIQAENTTLASITFQNYFRMYRKLSGMTGTADTEAFEFKEIYNLETVVIPTNRPMVRKDRLDQIYKTNSAKFKAVLADIKDCYERGQPVLVGTTSIENSELIAKLLTKEKLPFQLLNAKQHAREAEIIAQAGRPKMITIATNMAGRGTDIVLGGNPEPDILRIQNDPNLTPEEIERGVEVIKTEWDEVHRHVLELGGLHIIGTERHESRRIDNQLRGRAGRQGDNGSSRFYLSLEDPLLRIFASERIEGIMNRLNLPEDEAIEHPLVSRSIESAQRKVESRNFDVRKQLLEYDNVANEQRTVLYNNRNEILEAQDVSEMIQNTIYDMLDKAIEQYMPSDVLAENWEIVALEHFLDAEYRLKLPLQEWYKDTSLTREDFRNRILEAGMNQYHDKVERSDKASFIHFERVVMLQTMDHHWREHLSGLEHLRQGIHLRGYAQKDPKNEYKKEAFDLFASLFDNMKRDIAQVVMSVELSSAEDFEDYENEVEPDLEHLNLIHESLDSSFQSERNDDEAQLSLNKIMSEQKPAINMEKKVSRNEPCPCGSGKKYKHCHGKLG